METVVLVSVLSTLGVVAVLGWIAVMFVKANNKVEAMISKYDHEIGHLYDAFYRKADELSREYESAHNNLSTDMENELRETNDRISRTNEYLDGRVRDCFSFVDSRCDKLDDKISQNKKQLLND